MSQEDLERRVAALEAQAGTSGGQEVSGHTAGGQASDEHDAALQAFLQAAIAAYAASQQPRDVATFLASQQSHGVTPSVAFQQQGAQALNWYWWGARIYFDHNDSTVIAAGGAAAAAVLAAAGAPAWIGVLVGAIAAWVKGADQGNGIYLYYTWAQVWWIRSA